MPTERMAPGHSVEDENNLSYEELVEDMDDSEPSTNQEIIYFHTYKVKAGFLMILIRTTQSGHFAFVNP